MGCSSDLMKINGHVVWEEERIYEKRGLAHLLAMSTSGSDWESLPLPSSDLNHRPLLSVTWNRSGEQKAEMTVNPVKRCVPSPTSKKGMYKFTLGSDTLIMMITINSSWVEIVKVGSAWIHQRSHFLLLLAFHLIPINWFSSLCDTMFDTCQTYRRRSMFGEWMDSTLLWYYSREFFVVRPPDQVWVRGVTIYRVGFPFLAACRRLSQMKDFRSCLRCKIRKRRKFDSVSG